MKLEEVEKKGGNNLFNQLHNLEGVCQEERSDFIVGYPCKYRIY